MSTGVSLSTWECKLVFEFADVASQSKMLVAAIKRQLPDHSAGLILSTAVIDRSLNTKNTNA